MSIRTLTADDLERCLDLAELVDWPREERKWRMLLGVGQAVGIERDGGALLAGGVVVLFKDALAVIGMMMVDPAQGRRGLGGRILEALLERANGIPAMLYATEEGRRLYERSGFETSDEVVTYDGRLSAIPPLERSIWRVGVEALDDLGAYDSAIMGADRRSLLAPWLENNVKCVVAYGDEAAITGYAMVWKNEDLCHVGPVLADDDAIARALIAAGLEESHLSYRIDIPRGKPEIAQWVQDLGLSAGRMAPLMVRDGAYPDGHSAKLYGLGLQATS